MSKTLLHEPLTKAHHDHHDHDHHDHNHSHADARSADKKALCIAIALTFTMAIIELIYSFISGSISLLSDTLHMFSDTLALGLSLLAIVLADRLKSDKFSFGYYRLEILASFTNALSIFILVIFIAIKALGRAFMPQEIDAHSMLPVAVIGLIINIVAALIMMRSSQSLNMRSALLHIISDLLGSVAVIIGAVAIMLYEIYFIDTILALLISITLIKHSVALLKSSSVILLEGSMIKLEEVQRDILKVAGVKSIKDLHITQITENMLVATAHIVLQKDAPFEQISSKISKMLLKNYHIAHSTIEPSWSE